MKVEYFFATRVVSELNIKDRNLCISVEKPYYLIERGPDNVKRVIESFEPVKNDCFNNKYPLSTDACTNWPRTVDKVRYCFTDNLDDLLFF